MLKAAFVSFVLFALLSGKGWITDTLAQASLGMFFGAAVGEGLFRAGCLLIRKWYRRIPLAFAPLTLFVLHAYALTCVDVIYFNVLGVGIFLGAVFWIVMLFGEGCERIVDGMNDLVCGISSKGG